MADLVPIPIPWPQRWRRVRLQLMPLAVFGLAVLLTGWLWTRHYGVPNAVGEVFADRADIFAPVDGTLVDLSEGNFKTVELNQPVAANAPVAKLDDSQLRADRKVLEEQGRQVDAQLKEIEEKTKFEIENLRSRIELQEGNDQTRWQVFLMEQRLAQMQVSAQIADYRSKLGPLETTVKYQREALKRDAVTKAVVEANEASIKGLKEAIVAKQKELEAAKKNEVDAEKKVDKFAGTKTYAPDMSNLTAPLLQQKEVLRAQIEAVDARIKLMEIRSPISGVVRNILVRPGSGVQAGQLIMTIAARESNYILAYVRQSRAAAPQPGTAVDIRLRGIPTQTVSSRVKQVGDQIEQVPLHLQRVNDANAPEWGLPVLIELPPDLAARGMLKPGELVDLRFRAGTSANRPTRRTNATQTKQSGRPEI